MRLTEDLAVLDLDIDSLGTELVDTISLSDEEGSQLVGVIGGVDVLGQTEVDVISGDRDVDLASSLQLEDELLEVGDVLRESEGVMAYVFLLSDDVLQVDEALLELVGLVILGLDHIGGSVKLSSEGVAVV